MPQDPCPERVSLSNTVAAAVTETYRAKGKCDLANENQAGNVDQLTDVLSKATAAERAALRTLQEHINQHGCKIWEQGAWRQPRFPRSVMESACSLCIRFGSTTGNWRGTRGADAGIRGAYALFARQDTV